MVIKIKRYIAKVRDFVENPDGTVAAAEKEIEITGERIRNETVLKQIPRYAKLLDHGYVVNEYEIDKNALEVFLKNYGNQID